MRKLNKPIDTVEYVFTICISKIRPTLKNRLELCKTDVVAAAKDFEIKIEKGHLHKIKSKDNLHPNISADEMEKVYTRMLDKKHPARVFYDKLLATPKHGRCPLCGHNPVATIDHHLPKELYPILCIVLSNLIPACRNCNSNKGTFYAKCSEEETIHPYFDDVETDTWLQASVIQSNPVSIEFSVSNPSNWTDLLGKRVKYHFGLFKLAKLYSTQAACELGDIQYNLTKLFNASGAQSVQEYLLDAAISRENNHKNSWQTAMYRALANCSWFYSGGFKH